MIIPKTAAITGAGHYPGIGSQVALDLLESGNNVAIISRTFDSFWYRLTEKYKETLVLYTGDISDQHIQKDFLSTINDTFNQLDYLVNNASSGSAEYTEDYLISSNTWVENFNINVITVYNFSCLCRRYLKETKGSIVNIGSRAATMNKVGNNLAYSVSKAALLKLTQEMAIDFAPEITVNAVSPGFVDTARLRNIFGNNFDSIQKTRLAVSVHDVSQMILTVLRTKAINGQNISACGGTNLPINSSVSRNNDEKYN